MRPTPPSHPSHGAASCHRPARLLVASTAVLLGLLPGLPACGLLPQAGAPSSSSATPVVQADGAARQAADPQDLEGPEDSEDSGSSVPLNPLEYGNCTSEEVAEAGQATLAPDELDSSTDRAAAQAEVDHAVAGAETVTISSDAESYAGVVSVGPGTTHLTIEASHLVYVVDSDLETLTIRGSDNIVWVNSVREVVFEEATLTKGGVAEIDSGYFNQVFWRDTVPVSEQDDTGSNIVARDALAHIALLCSPSS